MDYNCRKRVKGKVTGQDQGFIRWKEVTSLNPGQTAPEVFHIFIIAHVCS